MKNQIITTVCERKEVKNKKWKGKIEKWKNDKMDKIVTKLESSISFLYQPTRKSSKKKNLCMLHISNTRIPKS